MQEKNVPLFTAEFNSAIKIEARAERLTSEAGAVLLRETIERLRITKDLTARLHDERDPELIVHPLEELLNTLLIMYGQGWQNLDDVDALRHDPAMRLAVSTRRGTAPLRSEPTEEKDDEDGVHRSKEPDGLASQPTQSRVVRMLSSEHNRAVLSDMLFEVTARRVLMRNGGRKLRRATLDVDSLPLDVAGHQPGSAYNGHYHARIYHPQVATIAQTGDIVGVELREGTVHTAQGATTFILRLVDLAERLLCRKAEVRMDAGFPTEELLAALEARGTPYTARLRNNPVLDRMAAPYLTRPVGRPPVEPRLWTHEMTYQAKSWSRARRVVLVMLERPSELFLDYFWLVTSWSPAQKDGPALLAYYRRRGVAESLMGELKDVLDPALSSSPRPKSCYRDQAPRTISPSVDSFAVNETILLLNALAYDVMNAVRSLVAEATGTGWSLQRLRDRFLRIAARVLLHGRQVVVVINKSAALLWAILWEKLQPLCWSGP